MPFQVREVLGQSNVVGCEADAGIGGDSDGKRLVRKGETNLGDLCADAFQEGVHADIGILNSGGIRNGIPAGTITFGKVYGVLPFFNLTCKIEVTGKYEPIEANRKYTIGTLDYYSTGGFHDMLKQATLLEMTEEQACNTLARHIKDFLSGNIPDTYRESQNRITIIND